MTYAQLEPIIREKYWKMPLRVWHGQTHLDRMLRELASLNFSDKDRLLLKYFCLFHDAVYIPGSTTNEHQSVLVFFEAETSDLTNDDKALVAKLILQTKNHVFSSFDPLAEAAHGLDLSVLFDPFPANLLWEEGISQEFSWLGIDKYKSGRLKFLRSVHDKNPDGIGKLIDYVKQTRRNQ